MKRALPGGLTVVLGIGALLVLQNVFSIPQEQLSVMAVFNTAAVCFGVLIGVCRPFRKWHTAMIAAVAAAFCAASWLFGGLFYITPLNWREWLCLAVMIPASLVILYGLRLLLGKLLSRWSGGFPAASKLKKAAAVAVLSLSAVIRALVRNGFHRPHVRCIRSRTVVRAPTARRLLAGRVL